MKIEPKKILEELRRENAEDLKARIIRRVEDILRDSTAASHRIKEIEIILPDADGK